MRLTNIYVWLAALVLLGSNINAQAQSSWLIPGSNFGPIPDAPGAGPKFYGEPRDIEFTVTSLAGNVVSAGVFFDASHTWVGDLRVTLIAPDGRSHILFENTGAQTAGSGGSGSDLVAENRYSFRDDHVTNWWTTAASGNTQVPSGSYVTVEAGGDGVPNPPATTSLNDVFLTASPIGTWRLRFEDGWEGDTGEVVEAELALTVSEQTQVVTTTADSGPGSLREALTLAQSGDLIQFASPLFDTEQEILLQSRLPDIADGITIKGPGAMLLTIARDSVDDFRILNIPEDHVATISGVHLTNGSEPATRGGGIANGGRLFLIDSMVSSSFANGGGGVYNGNVDSELTMIGSSVFSNTVNFQGGGIYNHNSSTALIVQSTIVNNNSNGSGGGISHGSFSNTNGFMELSSNTITGNQPKGLDIFTQGPNAMSTTLISNNLFADSDTVVQARAISGANAPVVLSGGFNLSTDDGNGLLDQATDKLDSNADLEPLGGHGGKTLVVAIGLNSDAIDAGNSPGTALYDQRGTGFDRVVDFAATPDAPGSDGSDIGAFENQDGPDVIFNNNFD
ncbi:MAG: hypothetical protein DHS20C11_21300 [Lysobacteraceae bacterium]|nr:MAG: hypothetical protein DHS20C11_21300 [Xanthomonadaceae bacterium]